MKRADLPDLLTVSRLSALAHLDRREVEVRLAGVEPAERRGAARYFRLADAMPALCRLSGGAGERSLADSRQREASARADLAELERARRVGELAAEFRAALVDYWTRSRVAIEGADYLNAAQKKKISHDLNAITLGP